MFEFLKKLFSGSEPVVQEKMDHYTVVSFEHIKTVAIHRVYNDPDHGTHTCVDVIDPDGWVNNLKYHCSEERHRGIVEDFLAYQNRNNKTQTEEVPVTSDKTANSNLVNVLNRKLLKLDTPLEDGVVVTTDSVLNHLKALWKIPNPNISVIFGTLRDKETKTLDTEMRIGYVTRLFVDNGYLCCDLEIDLVKLTGVSDPSSIQDASLLMSHIRFEPVYRCTSEPMGGEADVLHSNSFQILQICATFIERE